MPQDLLKIYDGRPNFWQWDTGQKLIVLDRTIDQVHFSNKNMTTAVVKEVYVDDDGMRLCDVPDMMLKMPQSLIAYAYVMDDDQNRTICAVKFSVSTRPIPEDYTYEENNRFKDLVDKIEAVEDVLESGASVRKFYTIDAAEAWAKDYQATGIIVSAYDGYEWALYMIGPDYSLEQIGDTDQLIIDVETLQHLVGETSVEEQIRLAILALDLPHTYDPLGAAETVRGELAEETKRAQNEEAAITRELHKINDNISSLQDDVQKNKADTDAAVKVIADDYLKKADKTELEGKIKSNTDAIAVEKSRAEDVEDKLASRLKTVENLVGDGSFIKDADFVSYNEQELTDEQKVQARANIDSASSAEVAYIDPEDNETIEEPNSSVGSGIDVTAEVGQTIVVKEIDSNGKPTKWEAADLNNYDWFKVDFYQGFGYIAIEGDLDIEKALATPNQSDAGAHVSALADLADWLTGVFGVVSNSQMLTNLGFASANVLAMMTSGAFSTDKNFYIYRRNGNSEEVEYMVSIRYSSYYNTINFTCYPTFCANVSLSVGSIVYDHVNKVIKTDSTAFYKKIDRTLMEDKVPADAKAVGDALATKISFTESQELTDEQKAQARSNINSLGYDWHTAYESGSTAIMFANYNEANPISNWENGLSVPSVSGGNGNALSEFLQSLCHILRSGTMADYYVKLFVDAGKALMDTGVLSDNTFYKFACVTSTQNAQIPERIAFVNVLHQSGKACWQITDDADWSKTRAAKINDDYTIGVSTLEQTDKTLTKSGRPSDAQAVGDALSTKVSFIEAQNLTDEQKAQARANIGRYNWHAVKHSGLGSYEIAAENEDIWNKIIAVGDASTYFEGTPAIVTLAAASAALSGNFYNPKTIMSYYIAPSIVKIIDECGFDASGFRIYVKNEYDDTLKHDFLFNNNSENEPYLIISNVSGVIGIIQYNIERDEIVFNSLSHCGVSKTLNTSGYAADSKVTGDAIAALEARVAALEKVVTDEHINALIDTKLGVIENGTY